MLERSFLIHRICAFCCSLLFLSGCFLPLLLRFIEHGRLLHYKSTGIGIEVNMRVVREQTGASHILAGCVNLYLAKLGIERSHFVVGGIVEIFYFLNRFGQCPVRAAYAYYDFQSHSFGTDEGDAGMFTFFRQRQDACQLFLIQVVDIYDDISLVADECRTRASTPVAG